LTSLDVNAVKNVSDTKVFPNPITTFFSVCFSLSENTELNISVVGMNGKIVKELYEGVATSGDNVFSFDKSNLSAGVYFLVIKSNDKIFKNEKIIIAN